MKPQLTQFESKTPLTIVDIDLDQKSSADYKKYIGKMTSRSIPFTIILSPKGEILYQVTGYRTSGQLVEETKKYWK